MEKVTISMSKEKKIKNKHVLIWIGECREEWLIAFFVAGRVFGHMPARKSKPSASSAVPSQHAAHGPAMATDPPPRRWRWHPLTDSSTSAHPPVFTRDGRCVSLRAIASPHSTMSLAISSPSLVPLSKSTRRPPERSYPRYPDHKMKATPTSLPPLS